MTTWASSDFTGGAIGTQASVTTEPIFAAKVGTINYAAGVAGSSQSIEPLSTATGSFQIDFGGRTHVRLAIDVQRVSGTQGAGLALFLFRDGATNRGDAFLRNAGGGQMALRGNTANATNYIGQSTRTFATGETYHLEMEWESGVGFKLYQWYPGNSSGTPDETYTSAMTLGVTNAVFGNPSSATVALVMRTANFRATDGEQVRVGVSAGTLVYNLVGLATDTTIRAVAKTSGATSVRMVASTSVSMTSPIYGPAVTPDADQYSQHEITGLAANTQYYWAMEVDGNLNASVNGKAKTLPTPGSQASFSFWTGSCHDSPGSSVFGFILARNPLFGVQLGDMGYPYITGGLGTGPNQNIAPTDTAQIRTNRELTITATNPNLLYRSVPFSHTYSDCDGPGGNGDGTWPALVGGQVQAAYRQQFAHPPLSMSTNGARSWIVGRIRMVHTDELTLSSSRDATDNSSKTKLGTDQKAWFKAELLAAKAAGQIVVWCGDGPWLTAATTGTDNSWGRYMTERAELGTFISTNRIRIVRIHGDSHTLFADWGTNNNAGGFPTISAAPMHTTAQAFGRPTTSGSYPSATTNSARQYGIYDIVDTGNNISMTYHGYSSTVSAPTEVERVTMTLVWSMWNDVKVGATPALAVYTNGQLVWSSATS